MTINTMISAQDTSIEAESADTPTSSAGASATGSTSTKSNDSAASAPITPANLSSGHSSPMAGMHFLPPPPPPAGTTNSNSPDCSAGSGSSATTTSHSTASSGTSATADLKAGHLAPLWMAAGQTTQDWTLPTVSGRFDTLTAKGFGGQWGFHHSLDMGSIAPVSQS